MLSYIFRCITAFILLNITNRFWFFVSEPRGSSQDSFEAVLKGYYNSICHGTRQASGRKIRGKKLGLKNGSSVESTKDTKKAGAAFLAVCRGKVIQAIPLFDFSSHNSMVFYLH